MLHVDSLLAYLFKLVYYLSDLILDTCCPETSLYQ